MSFDSMIEMDLAACNEFGGVLIHTKNQISEELGYLTFDAKTDILLQKDDFSEVEAQVPVVTLQKSIATNISHKSTLQIAQVIYGVNEVSHQNDGTTKVFLEEIE